MTDQHRDDDLGPEIRDLPVPEHKAGFWERLDRRLEAEGAVEDRRRRQPGRAAPTQSALVRYLPLLIAALVIIVIVVLIAL